MAKYMLRAFAMRNPAPASVLFHLNNALVKGFDTDRFTTLLYAVFDPDESRCHVACGGHPAPLLYRGVGGEIETVPTDGSILGAFQDQQYEPATVEIGSRDVLVMFTDGLVEARADDVLYGRERVARSVRRHAPRLGAGDLARRLYEDVERFGRISDDTIVFVLAPKR
jgi:sigma-B regulation protein RsbU (phosphoserine phosphatase)